MKKIFFATASLYLLTGLGTSQAQPSVSPQRLENYIRRVCPMYNVPNGHMLESRYNITEFRDGKWTCDDRAEVAKRIAKKFGYDAIYGIDKTSDPKIFHRFIVVTNEEGDQYQVLRSKFHPSEE